MIVRIGICAVIPAIPALLFGAVFAAAPSMKHDMPREILSWRDEILSRDEYEGLVSQWQTYIERHPASAAAHVQLARAMRYAGESEEEQNRVIQRAFELDPDCPEALDAVAGTAFNDVAPLLCHEEAIRYLERAIELAPHWTYPHCNLCSLGLVTGRIDFAHEHARALVRKGGIPAPLMDFAYNMLVSAEPGATIITNGDNDTYPLLALQAAHGLRTDVVVAPVGALNRIAFARSAWRHVFGDDVPLTDGELEKIHSRAKTDSEPSGETHASRVMSALFEKVRAGEWRKPVYFALTTASAHRQACPLELEIHGLLWRVLPTSKGADDHELLVDVTKTRRLVLDEFRLESATDLSYPWLPESAILLVVRVYTGILCLLAERSADLGNLEASRLAFHTVLEMLEFHGDEARIQDVATSWKEIDPENPEINRWIQ